MRHTNATLQREARIHPKVVQERLGHSDIGVTLGRDAAQGFDAVFGKGGIDGEGQAGAARMPPWGVSHNRQ